MELTSEMGRATRPQDDRHERIALHEIELIKYRDNRTPLVVKLLTGETLEGAIRWYDDRAMRLVLADRSEITLCRQAIAYYRTQI